MKYGDRLKQLRNEKKLSQQELADKLEINRSTYARYETSATQPDYETLQKLADFFDVSIDYLLGRTDKSLPELTKKDERDIQKDLEKLIQGLDGNAGYSHFGGQNIEDFDEEDLELLKSSLENAMRIGKRIAKQKFTPKKYRKDD